MQKVTSLSNDFLCHYNLPTAKIEKKFFQMSVTSGAFALSSSCLPVSLHGSARPPPDGVSAKFGIGDLREN